MPEVLPGGAWLKVNVNLETEKAMAGLSLLHAPPAACSGFTESYVPQFAA